MSRKQDVIRQLTLLGRSVRQMATIMGTTEDVVCAEITRLQVEEAEDDDELSDDEDGDDDFDFDDDMYYDDDDC